MTRARRPIVREGGFLLSSQIRIGDCVRITTKTDDMISSHVGIVAKRDYVGRGTAFYTATGQLLGVDWHDTVSVFSARLLRMPKELLDAPLEGFDALMEIVNGNTDAPGS